MKAITLTQPWATLVAFGAKRVETRSWPTRHRGPIAIHAAKGLKPVGGRKGLEELCHSEPFEEVLQQVVGIRRRDGHGVDVDRLPLGMVVAVAEVGACKPTHYFHQTEFVRCARHEDDFGDYGPGRYGFILRRAHQLREPVSARGSLGVWELPVEVEAQVTAAVEAVFA